MVIKGAFGRVGSAWRGDEESARPNLGMFVKACYHDLAEMGLGFSRSRRALLNVSHTLVQLYV